MNHVWGAHGELKTGELNMTNSTERKCPFCAEKIKAAALLCRFCGSQLKNSVPDLTAKDFRYLNPQSQQLLLDSTEQINDLIPILDIIVDVAPGLRESIGTAENWLALTLFGVAADVIYADRRIDENELTLLLDIGVHLNLFDDQVDLVNLKSRIPVLAETGTLDSLIDAIHQYDGQVGTNFVLKAKKLFIDFADRIAANNPLSNNRKPQWLSQYKEDTKAQSQVGSNISYGQSTRVENRSSLEAVKKELPPKDSPAGELNDLGQSKDDYTLDEIIQELENLIGLSGVKSDVAQLVNFIKVQQMRAKQGLQSAPISRHLVFYGNPGTGKTTVARLIGKVYKSLGILSKGHFVEAARSSLVAGYLGQTAIKVKEVVNSAFGGVLFIDEAYSLSQGAQDSYGTEAIDTLLKLMEDHRNELIVIVAGYTDRMNEFINANPGLRSRFNKYFFFDDYNPKELMDIFQFFCHNAGFYTSPDADQCLTDLLLNLYENRKSNFGNARDVRNIFEQTLAKQANRLVLGSLDHSDLSQIAAEDIPAIKELESMPIDSPKTAM